jgi:hypothetical protein
VHAGIGALGVALVAIALVPVTGASVFHLDALAALVLVGVVGGGLLVGLIEGLLTRARNREIGDVLAGAAAVVCSVPAYAAVLFAHGPWAGVDEPLPTQNLVMAVLTWVGFTLALSAGLLLSSPRRAG